jgi:hypothetical protein
MKTIEQEYENGSYLQFQKLKQNQSADGRE